MSIHKLTAGGGYDYLTRQVAAMDATDKGHTGLASYYTERGETPGRWVGSGMAGIDGLTAGDVVTADQMQSLFGSGHHPLATERAARLAAANLSSAPDLSGRAGSRTRRPRGRPTLRDGGFDRQVREATRLGQPFRVHHGDVSPFRIEVARRFEEHNAVVGLPRDWAVPATERARIRTQVAREFFRAEYGRDPADARELAATIAKNSRPKTTAVAGYDLTFSPVKSLSVLWALADPATAARLEEAHNAAVADALRFIEDRASFTRTGTNGVRQVDVRGLVATAFTHRDSRAGDPDLHTHVAVANKVQTLDGRWLSIDGRVLFKATVTASEVYNTALETHCRTLGLRFAERPDPDVGKRPVREVVGVDPALTQVFSKRRIRVEERRGVLAMQFQSTHGRPPTPVESLRLDQQATLETRDAKHSPRTLGEQRRAWHAEAIQVLGGHRQLQAMLHHISTPGPGVSIRADAAWVDRAADRVLAAMETRRATWQGWHVRAEALRQVRAVDLPEERVGALVDQLVEEVLTGRSVRLARPAPDALAEPEEPEQLRRRDGASVYTVTGADLFTSATILDAEQRLVAIAGRYDGRRIPHSCVEVALLEETANGVALNPGQTALVRQMATSGARMQLAIAPAGSGKTTAMRALARAWSEGGGTVIGLAPSAAAADALRSQIDSRTDTLAKLTWSLHTGDIPAWVAAIGPETLVVIDEAGMADTLSLAGAVDYVIGRGGSVRLIGDDQQLAAIGAGGVLRDIHATHGAVQLSQLVRFADPAEGAASLALRNGRTEALGFYLDRGRVHVGDLATITEDVFASWQADRAAGLDSIMLAPTRELVSELNQRARAHRLDAVCPAAVGRTRRLGDGNTASIGELIITRANDRRLRTSTTDWVKNGDRWLVLDIDDSGDIGDIDGRGDGGGLTVRHVRSGRTVRLPAEYVDSATELGYATTVHTAQGVTADTMHGLADGQESRQQLYTMLTRGRVGNHLYLEVAGDGDPHSVIRPELTHPLTPTDLLERILGRDDAPQSATSRRRAHEDPATRLGEATTRYVDALYVAAETTVGFETGGRLDEAADQLVPGLTQAPAWPVLRAHLLLLAAGGADPTQQLADAASEAELDTARDPAAVLDWRLDDTGMRSTGAGPLPWVPGVPATLRQDPQWGDYLARRAELVTALAGEVHTRAHHQATARTTRPAWLASGMCTDPDVVADIEVWRAASSVDVEDRRPTGPPQPQKAAALWQRKLNKRVTGEHTPALAEWGPLLHSLAAHTSVDPFTPRLADRLAAIARAGLPARDIVRTAVAERPLPDDHAAAAVWWRISAHLAPAVAAQVDGTHLLTTDWQPRLGDLLGPERAGRIQASPAWPALVSVVDQGLQRGWRLEDLLTVPQPDTETGTGTGVGARAGTGTRGGAAGWEAGDECEAMVWRTSLVLQPVPLDDARGEPTPDYEPHEAPPEDMRDGAEPPALDDPHVVWAPGGLEKSLVPTAQRAAPITTPSRLTSPRSTTDLSPGPPPTPGSVDLAAAARRRQLQPPLEPSDADIDRMLERAAAWDHCPVPRERMLHINALTHTWFEDHYPGSWGRAYLAGRFGFDLAGDGDFRPGQAPAGWTGLVTQLRRLGVTDEEMLATGVATTTRTGRLIDRFRDRVMFPITSPDGGEILGFIGRRHPDLTDVDATDGHAGPKYLNTAENPLFHKGAQLFGVIDAHVATGAIPVVVEGPTDAIAVTLASAGTYLGVAPLGTSLTEDHARQLANIAATCGRRPILATDADLAGRLAAERDYWMLTSHGLNPRCACLPSGSDPASLLAERGPAALVTALTKAGPLGHLLLDERLANLPKGQALAAAADVVAAMSGEDWENQVAHLAEHTHTDPRQVTDRLAAAITRWDADPRRAAQHQLHNISTVRARLEAATNTTPAQRSNLPADELGPRPSTASDCPAAVAHRDHVHDHGLDVATAVRALLKEALPLDEQPVTDPRNGPLTRLNADHNPEVTDPTTPMPNGAAHERRHVHEHHNPPSGSRRR